MAVAAAASGALVLGHTGGGWRPGAVARAARFAPNIVVVMSDDQTQATLQFMPNVRSLIARRGARFPDSFVNEPLCCPSRSTLLTGQYAHNHGVLDNTPPDGGFDKLDSSSTLPVWLRRAGYYTGEIGKYLNGYQSHRNDANPIPPGWTEWHAATVSDDYYSYELAENHYDGLFHDEVSLRDYGAAPQDYSTDVYTAKAVDFVTRRAIYDQPFFLWLNYLGPHVGGPEPSPNPPSDCEGTAKPAPRDADALDGAHLPIPPSFNEADVSDKPGDIQAQPPLTGGDIANIRRRYRCRAESLLSEDRGVGEIMRALRDSGELHNTMVLFTSDNGFIEGEHRVDGKARLYEEALRVPLAIRGPGVVPDTTVREMATNADLAATILDAANATPGLPQDGRSLLPLTRHPSRERGRALEMETRTAEAIHTRRDLYVEHHSGERELYDLVRDPYELRSRHHDPAYAATKERLATELASLRHCSGRACLRTPAVSLAIGARRGPGGCRRRPVAAALAGDGAGHLVEARFHVDGRLAGTDRTAPFRIGLPWSRLSRHASARVDAVAWFDDGRRMTLERRVSACR